MTKDEMIESGYHSALLDAYSFMKKYGTVKNTEEYWNTVAEASCAISKKYEGTNSSKFIISLLIAALDELQRTSNQRTQ